MRNAISIASPEEGSGLRQRHINHVLRGRQTISFATMIAITHAIGKVNLWPAPANLEHEWDTIQAAVEAFRIVDVEAHHVRRSGTVQRALTAQGLRGRKVPDLVIAASAEDHGLPVVHYDQDFDHIAAITGQAVTWIVPAGSIN